MALTPKNEATLPGYIQVCYMLTQSLRKIIILDWNRRFLAQEHLIEQMPLFSKPGILVRTSFRPFELNKKGQFLHEGIRQGNS